MGALPNLPHATAATVNPAKASSDAFFLVNAPCPQCSLALAPLAVQATKRSLQEMARGHGDEQRLREREHQTCTSADFAEGRAAFAQRRKPVFTGA